MKDYIRSRIYESAEYVLENKATIRETARKMMISKSTVHKDLRERLALLDGKLFNEVKEVLEENLEQRHIRGGASTKAKYFS